MPEELSKKGHRVYGLDIQDYGKHKGFTFLKADIISSDLPFEMHMFDYIVLLSTLEHIGLGYYGDSTDKRGDRKALERIHSLLKSDGRLLVTIPFSRKYSENNYQRIHTKASFLNLISNLFEIEKEQYWIPSPKKKWIAATEEKAEKVYNVHPESNNACFVLKKWTNEESTNSLWDETGSNKACICEPSSEN